MHVLSRYELFNLVWTMPTTTLAAQLGISGKGLANICAKMEVPVPPRGYWAKVKAGHNPPKGGLPPENPDTVLAHEIDFTNSSLQRSLHQEKRTKVDVAEAEVPAFEPISLKEALTDLHPVVRTTRHVYREGIRPYYGRRRILPRWVKIEVPKPRLNIALLFLENFVRRLEERGFTLVSDWDLHPETIEKGPDAFRCFIHHGNHRCSFEIIHDPKSLNDVNSSGLCLRVGRAFAAHTEWGDQSGRPLSQRIPEVLDWLVQHFQRQIESSLRMAAESERMRLLREERAREQERIEIERKALEHAVAVRAAAEQELWSLAELSEKADKLEAYLAKVDASAPAEWISWARGKLASTRAAVAQPWVSESFLQMQSL